MRTKLSRTLRRDPDARFVDYDYYAPSDEAASSFVARVTRVGGALGWIIFQFSINTINSLLADYESLGRMGEVYLTNEEKIMVTQSRLVSGDTVLKQKFDTEAIRKALANNSGNKVIRDYRDVRVFSSFEKFSFLGGTWIIVAVHTKGFGNVVGKLLNEGFFLSQIKLLYDPGMRYANISSDVGGAFTAVEWLGPDGRSANWTGVNGSEDLGELVKSISGYAS